MLFVTTQPDSDYYIWQIQVQLNNFKKFGSEDKFIVIFGYNPTIGVNPKVYALEKNTHATIRYYPDNRDLSSRLYSPSIRPHLLKQFYDQDYNLIENRNYLYLDCDTIFTQYPNFSELNDEKCVHVSNTNAHLSFDKLKKRNPLLFEEMCRSVGITSYVVNKNKHTAGGVVFLFKKYNYFDYEFWNKVETDSNKLYKLMLVSSDKYTNFEMITANKWALLWNLWLIGYDTKVTEELSVSLATNPIEDWSKNNLYNNAGVTDDKREILFKKSDFIHKTPFFEDLSYVSPEYASYKYVQEIKATAEALNLTK